MKRDGLVIYIKTIDKKLHEKRGKIALAGSFYHHNKSFLHHLRFDILKV